MNELNYLLIRIKYYVFFFGSLVLCTALFQLFQVKFYIKLGYIFWWNFFSRNPKKNILFQSALDNNEMLFQFIAVCMCDILVLFIYCFGGEIVIYAYDISSDVYQLNWYQFNRKSKMLIRLMIARTQKPYNFASLKAFNCSLETFANVWSNFFFYFVFHALFAVLLFVGSFFQI